VSITHLISGVNRRPHEGSLSVYAARDDKPHYQRASF